MSPYRWFSIGLCFVGLLCGCASHYYRIDANSMRMVLRRPTAEKVMLYSSLDGFSPCVAAQNGGSWVNFLPADREFRYFYKVDGHVFIPDCRLKEKDDFGLENCVYLPGL